MPYKSGKMKGELTTTEIRKLIRAHNVLVSIKIPKGSKREDIMAIVKKAGYMVDHEKQALRPVSKGKVKKLPVVDMNKATQVLPKPKTKEEKAVAKKSKDMKKKEKEDKIKAEGVKQGAAIQRVLAKKKEMDRKKILKNKNLSNNKKDMDFKIGDTYLFKIKTKEFEGIASKINDKSISMVFKWVNGNTLTKPINKENIIKRLGGTDYDEDLMERYKGLR